MAVRGRSGNGSGRVADARDDGVGTCGAGRSGRLFAAEMSYGEILKRAFAITRRNRYLWFFGLFAGGVSSFNLPTNFSPPSEGRPDPSAGGLPSVDPGLIIAAVAAILLLVFAVIVLGLIAQGALVESVAAIDRGGQRRFKTAWKSGTRTFWRVLGWAALLVVIALGILIVVGVPLGGIAFGVFSATESLGVRIAVGIVLALLAIAALIVLFVPLQIVAALAVRNLVLREEAPGRGVAKRLPHVPRAPRAEPAGLADPARHHDRSDDRGVRSHRRSHALRIDSGGRAVRRGPGAGGHRGDRAGRPDPDPTLSRGPRGARYLHALGMDTGVSAARPRG